MTPIIKKLIEANIEYIENGDFKTVYERALQLNIKLDVGELTDIFYDAGIDPLASMEELPSLFLDESKLTALVIPDNIKKINKAGCAFSKLESITLHKDCELSEESFLNSHIKSIIIPYIMNEVPEECFVNCTELTDVDLNAVEQISAQAFENCTSLRYLFIPDDINYIADSAFYDCPVVLYFHSNNEYAINYCQRTGMEYKFV